MEEMKFQSERREGEQGGENELGRLREETGESGGCKPGCVRWSFKLQHSACASNTLVRGSRAV